MSMSDPYITIHVAELVVPMVISFIAGIFFTLLLKEQ